MAGLNGWSRTETISPGAEIVPPCPQ